MGKLDPLTAKLPLRVLHQGVLDCSASCLDCKLLWRKASVKWTKAILQVWWVRTEKTGLSAAAHDGKSCMHVTSRKMSLCSKLKSVRGSINVGAQKPECLREGCLGAALSSPNEHLWFPKGHLKPVELKLLSTVRTHTQSFINTIGPTFS